VIAALPGFRHRITARRSARPTQGLIVDNFAGAGGASLGIEAAMGRAVDIAINHSRGAVEMHEINHPATRHLLCDVWEVDPTEACAGRPVDLAWFSPDCKHFSKAKGARPVSKRVRGLAWVVIKWAKAVRPTVIILENVEEFQTWGPLVGDRPCPDRKGQTFRRWLTMLRNLGYAVEWRELRACDFGVPTTRKRLFLIARCDGQPIVWPEPTHAEPKKAAAIGLKPWRTAAECIDWSLPCPSIFERKRPLADATLRRIANGIRRYVLEAKQPFIVRTGHWSHRSGEGFGFRGQGVGEPMATVCATNDKAIVAPTLVGIDHRGSGDSAAWGPQQPLTTVTSENRHALVSAFLAQFNTNPNGSVNAGHPATAPVSTIASRGPHQGVVTGHLTQFRGSNGGKGDPREPMPTLTAQGNHIAEVRAFLTAYFGNERDGQAVTDPMRTVTAKQRFGLVTIDGTDYQIVGIGLRMLAPHELLRAQFGRFADEYILTGTQAQQIAGIGNSVCPELAEALVRANCRGAASRPMRLRKAVGGVA
jgi:DNA (cytosine-5)-methyltransferase 1